MKISNRDQLDAGLTTLHSMCFQFGISTELEDGAAEVWRIKTDNYRQQILDALFPKPESERLKLLKLNREYWVPPLNPGQEFVLELFDAAIKEEEKKQDDLD